jgi:hypothetical protein
MQAISFVGSSSHYSGDIATMWASGREALAQQPTDIHRAGRYHAQRFRRSAGSSSSGIARRLTGIHNDHNRERWKV